MTLERRKPKMSALDRLLFADPSKTAEFNATFLAHVAWAFRVTSHLRNKIAGRGVAITRVQCDTTALSRVLEISRISGTVTLGPEG